MNRLPFEEWAPKEVARLRDEADALQRALDLYLGEKSEQSRYRQTTRTSEAPRNPRGSKYESAMLEFEKAGRSLSIDEMIDIAKQVGFDMDGPKMRSLVFAQKKTGRAIVDGDRYRWSSQQKEAASSPISTGDAAS